MKVKVCKITKIVLLIVLLIQVNILVRCIYRRIAFILVDSTKIHVENHSAHGTSRYREWRIKKINKRMLKHYIACIFSHANSWLLYKRFLYVYSFLFSLLRSLAVSGTRKDPHHIFPDRMIFVFCFSFPMHL